MTNKTKTAEEMRPVDMKATLIEGAVQSKESEEQESPPPAPAGVPLHKLTVFKDNKFSYIVPEDEKKKEEATIAEPEEAKPKRGRKKKELVNTEYSVETDFGNQTMEINRGYWNHKVMIGTPTTGVVRMEWVLARYGQVIPTNWSMMDTYMPLPMMHAPMRYLVPDAQNLIVKNVIEKKVEWLFLIEQDNVLPPDCFLRMNEYMRKADVPVVSGLYFTKSVPPEPMIYRGVGNSFYRDWKLGERVWCTGLPTGCVIIHSSILQALWDESPEYSAQGTITRRVFEAPEEVWLDPTNGAFQTNVGTSDLNFCNKLMTRDIFKKAGWSKYQEMENPFLVDTNIFVKHIDMNGRHFPLEIPEEYLPPVAPRDNK